MKIPAFRKLAFCLILAMAGFLSFAPSSFAQACAVTVSIATPSTASGSCFVGPATSMRWAVTGTWAGTANLDRSDDGGTSWNTVQSMTANANGRVYGTGTSGAVYRVYFANRTSGTVAGTLTGEKYSLTRSTFETVPMGSVAYSSFGSSQTVVAGSIYVADLVVGGNPLQPFVSTGGAVLNGTTAATDLIIYYLYDSAGNAVANTALAGTLSATGNVVQKIAWAPGPIQLPPGEYFLGWQGNGVTATFRSILVSTFVNVLTSVTTGVFGTQGTLTPPTTLTTGTGPIGFVY